MFVYPSVQMFQLENYWMDKNEIWYAYCAKGDYLQIMLLNILRLLVTKQWVKKVAGWDPQVVPSGGQSLNNFPS
jgi:hypothetical protein